MDVESGDREGKRGAGGEQRGGGWSGAVGRRRLSTPRLTDGARFWYSNPGLSFWPFMKSSDLMMRLFFLWMFDFHTL